MILVLLRFHSQMVKLVLLTDDGGNLCSGGGIGDIWHGIGL